MKNIILVLISILLLTGFAKNKPTIKFDHEHKLWTNELKKYVTDSGSNSTVNYKSWKLKTKPLEIYLQSLSNMNEAYFKRTTKQRQIAFLINAYNAFTVKLILDNYPVPSIKKIGGFFQNPWKLDFISLFNKKVSLDHIEHKLLRKNYTEPRIHFAVNCASIGCPKLRPEAFTGEKLNEQLASQKKVFLQDKTRNYVDKKNSALVVSKIFDWFEEDFTKNSSTVIKFVWEDLTGTPLKSKSSDWKLKYTPYNWDINKTP